jgi:large subunit ribosomal protein L21
MYAIVKTGGKQYRVEKGQTLLVERLPEEAGATVSLEPVLFRSDAVVFDADGLAKVKVDAKVVEHLRGEKLRVFKFKPKRGYRRRTGHRQELTRIEVTEIKQLSRRPTAKKKAADADDALASAAPQADAPASAAPQADAPASAAPQADAPAAPKQADPPATTTQETDE